MKILFAGTPEIAVPSLEACNAWGQVVGVLTNPDRPKGRGKKMIASPVKEKALELGLPLLQPWKLNEAMDEIESLGADILVCVAYGKIFSQAFLDLFPMGGVNLHPSALPQFRGPSPLNAAIANGLKESAISVQRLALKMDSGDILVQEPLIIEDRETTGSLTERAGIEGAPLLIRALKGLSDGTIAGVPQDDEKASYCSLIHKDQGQIDWSLPAKELDRMIRSVDPWPGAFSSWGDQKLFIRKANIYDGPWEPSGACGKVLGVDKTQGILVETGEGVLSVERLQIQSRKELDHRSFLNGNRDIINSQLGA